MTRSVEAGPCSECGYTWNAHPAPDQAYCPRCWNADIGADNDDTPRVKLTE